MPVAVAQSAIAYNHNSINVLYSDKSLDQRPFRDSSVDWSVTLFRKSCSTVDLTGVLHWESTHTSLIPSHAWLENAWHETVKQTESCVLIRVSNPGTISNPGISGLILGLWISKKTANLLAYKFLRGLQASKKQETLSVRPKWSSPMWSALIRLLNR